MEKYAVVIGASSGIGEACAVELAKAGYNLVLAARSREKLFLLGEKVKETYHVLTQVCETDLEKKEDLERLIGVLKEDYPSIDALVFASGIFVKTPLSLAAEELDQAYLNARKVMLDSPLQLTFHLKDLVKKFVYITSNAGLEENAYASQGVYCGVKAGLNHTIRAFAKEQPQRFYAIAPGNVDTPLLREEVKNEAVKRLVLEKYGSEDAFWKATLTSKDVAKKVVEILDKGSNDAVIEMESSEF